ncbi:MAG TPA: hypothetical protein VMR21_16790 [Vicinamibacteria bacterium]|nr:hypothetical protein [Vicinamibacteria bacterium]
MSADRLPAGVRTFITDHIRSIEQLEVLLLLQRDPEQWWSADGVAGELRTSRRSAEARLEEMASHNLLDVRTAEALLFRYHPVTAALDLAVKETAQAYAERRVAVTTFIYSTPTDDIRGFADAFRIRKGGQDG